MIIHVYLFNTNRYLGVSQLPLIHHEFFMNYFYGVLEYRSCFSPYLLSSIEFFVTRNLQPGDSQIAEMKEIKFFCAYLRFLRDVFSLSLRSKGFFSLVLLESTVP